MTVLADNVFSTVGVDCRVNALVRQRLVEDRTQIVAPNLAQTDEDMRLLRDAGADSREDYSDSRGFNSYSEHQDCQKQTPAALRSTLLHTG